MHRYLLPAMILLLAAMPSAVISSDPADIVDISAEEPAALPVIKDEPEMPDVKEDLTGNEPALPEEKTSTKTAAAQAVAETPEDTSIKEAQGHFDKAAALMKNGNYRSALDELTSADMLFTDKNKPKTLKTSMNKCRNELAKNEKKFKELLSKGLKLSKNGSYRASCDAYKQALKLNPGNGDAAALLKAAEEAYSAAIDALFADSVSNEKKGLITESVYALRKIGELDPGNTMAASTLESMDIRIKNEADRLNIAAVEKYTGWKYDEAIALWEKVLILTPGDEKILDNISKTKKKIKNINEMSGNKQSGTK